MVPLDAAPLAHAPRLAAVFYGAGSIRYFCSDALWDRGIVVTSAYAANAVPWSNSRWRRLCFRSTRLALHPRRAEPARLSGRPSRHTGVVWRHRRVIALGTIGRMVAERLAAFDLHVFAYDRLSTRDRGQAGCGTGCAGGAFPPQPGRLAPCAVAAGDVGLITGTHLAALPPDATFINTAAGPSSRSGDDRRAQQRPDLFAVLDVTYPEPPAADSPLYTLPNVVLTPHLAGSLGRECRRMGRTMVEELHRYLAGEAGCAGPSAVNRPRTWPRPG